jgi:rod shape-determining protein MreC
MQGSRLYRRAGLLLLVAVAAQVLLLAVQIKREGNMRLIRIWAAQLFTPVERAGTAGIGAAHNAWGDYVGLRRVRHENDALRAELDQLRLRIDALEGSAAEARRLEKLVGFEQEHPELKLLPARVIGASPSGATRILYIDRGAAQNVSRNMGVITAAGVVGKVLEVYRSSAQVLLLTDRESGIGALLEGSRTQGVVKGTDGSLPWMDYVVDDEPVKPGTRVLTSGLDRIFPKDLPIGTVVDTRPGNPFQKIRVAPASRLDRLEEVFVVLERPKALPPDKSLPAAQAADAGVNQLR